MEGLLVIAGDCTAADLYGLPPPGVGRGEGAGGGDLNVGEEVDMGVP
jgi:hypothetical protein